MKKLISIHTQNTKNYQKPANTYKHFSTSLLFPMINALSMAGVAMKINTRVKLFADYILMRHHNLVYTGSY